MGALLERLLEGSPAYTVRRETDGYTLAASRDHLKEFSQLVREVLDHPNDEFAVFPTAEGRDGYSQMFICPFEGDPAS